jgi:hypothetical protein
VPELDACIAFAPDPARLVTLNASAWLILGLCDGRTPEELEAAYLGAVSPPLPPERARAQLGAALDRLASLALVARPSA